MPGQNYVYECKKCGNLLSNGSLLSGNTNGAKIFSDGKRIAPMLPEFPNLTKCKKCKSFLWLDKLEEIGTFDSDDSKNIEWASADNAEFLTLAEYYNAIEAGIAEDDDDLFFIRQQIWWAYNDRIRKGEEIFQSLDDEEEWRENCQKLIAILDQSDFNQKIIKAELFRNF